MFDVNQKKHQASRGLSAIAELLVINYAMETKSLSHNNGG